MTDSKKLIRILLVEAGQNDLDLVRDILEDDSSFPHTLEWTSQFDKAMDLLAAKRFDVILLNPSVGHGGPMATIRSILKATPASPVIILSDLESVSRDLQAIQMGAQDCLERSEMDARRIIQTIRRSIERHRIIVNLRELSMLDPLTGLYNRRGFLKIAEKQISAHSSNAGESAEFALLYGDLDELKLINDHLGHPQGDAALRKAAEVLRKAFSSREDILARIGGDEFVVLTRLKGVEGEVDRLMQRVDEGFHEWNTSGQCLYAISMAIGVATCRENHADINKLIEKADAILRKKKRGDNASKDGQRALANS